MVTVLENYYFIVRHVLITKVYMPLGQNELLFLAYKIELEPTHLTAR